MAETSFRQAITVDPGHPGAHYAYARACVQQGRREEAALLLRRAADLAPGDVGYLNTLAALYRALGRAAPRRIWRPARHWPAPSAAWPISRARLWRRSRAPVCLAALGERDARHEWAERALRLGPDDHLTLYNVACAFALLGQHERAIEVLERAMANASPHRIAWMRQDRDLDPVRHDGRVAALFNGASGTA